MIGSSVTWLLRRAGALLPPVFLVVGVVFLGVVVGGCGGGGDDGTWSVLVYLDGDNDLGEAALRDLQEMEAAGFSARVQVVVQLDLPGGVPTRRYLLGPGGREEVADLGELDMAASETLAEFVAWGVANYPADRTALILWNHGNGWGQLDGPSAPVAGRRAFSILHERGGDDDSPFLPNQQVRGAIEAGLARSGGALDFLGLDASIMGTIEALYEFRDLAPVLVSSQEVGEANGWEYTGILGRLYAQPGLDAAALGTIVVDTYRNFFEEVFYPARPGYDQRYGIAAHRTEFFEPMASEVDALAVELMARLDDTETRQETLVRIGTARDQVQEIDRYFQPHVYADLSQLEQLLGLGTPIGALLDAATIAEYRGADRPEARGVSVVFFDLPDAVNKNTYDPNYRAYDPVTQTGNGGEFLSRFRWDEFLDAYYLAAGLR